VRKREHFVASVPDPLTQTSTTVDHFPQNLTREPDNSGKWPG
jgi:hypothetical protein